MLMTEGLKPRLCAGRCFPPAAQATPGQAPATGGVVGERCIRGALEDGKAMAEAQSALAEAGGHPGKDGEGA